MTDTDYKRQAWKIHEHDFQKLKNQEKLGNQHSTMVWMWNTVLNNSLGRKDKN